jgi:LysM repeat protein
MERTGKNILIILILFTLGLSRVWAASPPAITGPVPQQVGKPAPPKGYHVVEKGDTYYSLSHRYQVPVDSLKRWNGESLTLGATVQVSFTAGKKAVAPKPQTAPVKPQAAAVKPLPMVKPQAAAIKPQPAAPKPKPQPEGKKTQPAAGKTPASATAISAAKPGAATKSGLAPKAPAKAATNLKTAKPAAASTAASTTRSPYTGPPEYAPAKKEAQRVLVIPFDPYLYFSDADNDIALQSGIPKQNVRHIFRGRLNAFMDPKGFESINLLNGAFREGQDELARIYKSVSYSYQPITYSKYNPLPMTEKTGTGAVAWIQKQKEKLSAPPAPEAAGNSSVAKDPAKYWGVKVKDPDLYRYFNQNYAVDYYLFINQFEIHTDYTNCLDRTQNDFTREFLVHYTIFDNQGNLIAGNKMKVPYISHVNDIERIVRDNLNKMAQRILADLPQPAALTNQANPTE